MIEMKATEQLRKNENSKGVSKLKPMGWLLFLLVFFWSSLSSAEIYLYKEKGSYYLTDKYRGSNYVKKYKAKKHTIENKNQLSGKTMKGFKEDFSDEIYKASKKYDVSPNLIKAVIETESNFKPDAVSPKGAIGLMQLMPKTATSLDVDDPFDPDQNIDGGTRYLKHLLIQFRENKPLALAAYNAGENAVKKYGTIPPYKETTSYVRKVLNHYKSLERRKSLIYKHVSPNGTIIFSDDIQTKLTE